MRRRIVLVTVPLLYFVLGPGPAFSAGLAGLSSQCGECHKDIYRMWRGSAHAQALEDDIFQQAYRETDAREGAAVSKVCLRCHAPLAEINKDLTLERKSTWEGVNCNVCHSIASVEITPQGAKQVIDLSKVKRGPIENASSDAHEVAYSPLHATSLVCAGCHEYVNPEGTSIMSTYSEWMGSGAARDGKECQTCHMGRTKADVVDPKVRRVPDAEVNLHQVPGGHSLEQLHKALIMGIDPQRKGDSLLVSVRLTNKGAGHAMPTGMPGRRVILELEVKGGNGSSFHQERVYGRFFADARGETITRDSAYFVDGVRAQSDTRIGPDEKRVESFRFPLPAKSAAYVTVRLVYEHAPTGGEEGRVRLTFFSENRTVGAL